MLGALGSGGEVWCFSWPLGGDALPQRSGLRLSPSAPSGAQAPGASQARVQESRGNGNGGHLTGLKVSEGFFVLNRSKKAVIALHQACQTVSSITNGNGGGAGA